MGKERRPSRICDLLKDWWEVGGAPTSLRSFDAQGGSSISCALIMYRGQMASVSGITWLSARIDGSSRKKNPPPAIVSRRFTTRVAFCRFHAPRLRFPHAH